MMPLIRTDARVWACRLLRRNVRLRPTAPFVCDESRTANPVGRLFADEKTRCWPSFSSTDVGR